MKKLALIFITAGALLGGIGAGHAQQREGLHAARPDPSRMHRGVFHGDHHHRVVAIVVAVPIFVGPASSPYYSNYNYYPPSQPAYVEQDPPADMEQQPGGYWYYCADPEGYYPYVQNCPTALMLLAQ
jgi:hypothetical protein